MYEYAKLGSKATKMGVVALNSLVSEVVSDLNLNPALDMEIGIGDLPDVWGSEGLLRRVFANLIGNAVKYNDKPKITVRVTSGRMIKKGIGNFCEIIVEDNGPGIPGAEQKEIFNMFRRGSNADQKSEGSGIGLAIVQRIVELHFGEVKVESEVGQGSRFCIQLPLENLALES